MSRNRTKITVAESEKRAVRSLLKRERDGRHKERLIVARMSMTGQYTLGMIAQAVGRSRSTIQVWVDKFSSGGVNALLERGRAPGNLPALNEAIQQEVASHLRKGTWRSATAFREWLKSNFQIDMGRGGAYYWLRKCGGISRKKRTAPRNSGPICE